MRKFYSRVKKNDRIESRERGISYTLILNDKK